MADIQEHLPAALQGMPLFGGDIDFYRLLEYGGAAVNIAFRRYDASAFRFSLKDQRGGSGACLCGSDHLHGAADSCLFVWRGLSGRGNYLSGRNKGLKPVRRIES